MDIACNALLEEIVLKCVCILCFAGESRAELQGNGDASTAAATSGSLATSASFQPSLIILTTSLTFLLTFIQAQRQQSVWTSKHPHTPSYWKARRVRLGYHPSYMIKACSKEWYFCPIYPNCFMHVKFHSNFTNQQQAKNRTASTRNPKTWDLISFNAQTEIEILSRH